MVLQRFLIASFLQGRAVRHAASAHHSASSAFSARAHPHIFRLLLSARRSRLAAFSPPFKAVDNQFVKQHLSIYLPITTFAAQFLVHL
jgi:hypothetical protein